MKRCGGLTGCFAGSAGVAGAAAGAAGADAAGGASPGAPGGAITVPLGDQARALT